MKALILKTNEFMDFENAELKEINSVDELNIKENMEKETKGDVTLYGNNDEFIIIGNDLKNIIKTLFNVYTEFNDIENAIKKIFNKLNLDINAKEFVIENFPVQYINYLKAKNQF
jgi:hypothetical protein